MTDDEIVLELAGKLADAARVVAGGRSPLTGFDTAPASCFTLGAACKQLLEAVDAYDDAIVRLAQNRATAPTAAPSEGGGE